MPRLALTATLAAACYSPSAAPGGPCGPGGECPSGQECRSMVCYPVGAPDDAAIPVPVDAVDAAPDAAGYIPWTSPVTLTTLNVTTGNETDPSATTDKLTVAFMSNVATNDDDLYIATRSALTDTFTVTPLTTLNATGFKEEAPEISGDGLTIYFVSNRTGNDEVYKSTFTTVWSAPAIATDLSSTSNDGDLAISPDGLTAAVVRTGSTNRIYIYTRASTAASFSGATIHTELNVTTDIAAPTLTNDGDIIYFHAGATRDLYRATLKGNGSYTNPVPVTELNTAGRDAAPFVSQPDDYMIFERDGNILETSR